MFYGPNWDVELLQPRPGSEMEPSPVNCSIDREAAVTLTREDHRKN